MIRISDANYERLKEWAIPLEDSVDDALGKALSAAAEHRECTSEAQAATSAYPLNISTVEPKLAGVASDTQPRKNGRLRKGEGTPMKDFKEPILSILYQLGGSAHSKQVLKLVKLRIGPVLKGIDDQPVPSGGEIRWHKKANWARYVLVQEGLLKANSDWGIWELTQRGIDEVEKKKD